VCVCVCDKHDDRCRVYSQGCYVELATPDACQCRCEVVNHLCFIFPHDGDHRYQMEAACVLDTELMTLRLCGPELMGAAHALVEHQHQQREDKDEQQELQHTSSNAVQHKDKDKQQELQRHAVQQLSHLKYHFEVCESMMACFPHTPHLECLLHLASIAHVPHGVAQAGGGGGGGGGGAGGASPRAAPLKTRAEEEEEEDAMVGSHNARVRMQAVVFDSREPLAGGGSSGSRAPMPPSPAWAMQALETHSRAVFARRLCGEGSGEGMEAVVDESGGELCGSEAAFKDLRFVFKVVRSLWLMVAIVHDGNEALDFSHVFAVHCPPPSRDDAGSHKCESSSSSSSSSSASPALKTLRLCGDTLDALNGRRCALHLVQDVLVVIPRVSTSPHSPSSSPCLARVPCGLGEGGAWGNAVFVRCCGCSTLVALPCLVALPSSHPRCSPFLPPL
jgi:hypothetical protein